MNRLVHENFTRVAAEAVFIRWLHPGMGLVAFVAVQTSHGDFIREVLFRGFSVAGQTALAVRDEHALLLRRKRVAGHA